MRSEPNRGIPAAAGSPPPLPANNPMSVQPIVRNKFFRRRFIVTGSVHFVIGVLCIMFNFVSLIVSYDWLATIGHGFWCGILFIVTGGFGILAGKDRTRCRIIAYMVLCIISSLFGIFGVFAIGIAGAAVSTPRENNRCHGFCWQFPSYNPPYGNPSGYKISEAMEILLAISGFIEFILAIYSACICCLSGSCYCDCLCCQPYAPEIASIVYVSDNEQMFYIDLAQARQYARSPQAMMMAYSRGSAGQPPPYVATYTQPGRSVLPSQPRIAGYSSARTDTALEYGPTAEQPPPYNNNKI